MTYKKKLLDPRWQKRRLEILNRDDFTCQFCGDKSVTLHVHHISYNSKPWEAENKHLITLCSHCHKEETDNIKEATREAISGLKRAGFTSQLLSSVHCIFEDTDRGWGGYDPCIDILKMVVDDNELWNNMQELFFKRLKERRNNG